MTKQPPQRPIENRSIDRRQLLRDTSLAAGGAAIAGVALGDLAKAAPTRSDKPVIKLHQTASPVASPVASPGATPVPVDLDTYTPVALTDAELDTLKAITDRIFPADENGPSASEAGVFVYIDRALSGRYAEYLPLYQGGLAGLDTLAEGGSFVGLEAEGQDLTINGIEAGDAADYPEGFFGLLVQHTREGLFADPAYGGNRNFSGWDLIGYTGIRLVWTAEDQALDVLPEPTHASVTQWGGGDN